MMVALLLWTTVASITPRRSSRLFTENAVSEPVLYSVSQTVQLITNHILGAKLIYLPLYSPDMNPIEEAFHFMKTWLRRHEREALDPAARPWLIHQASMAVEGHLARLWFHNCGY